MRRLNEEQRAKLATQIYMKNLDSAIFKLREAVHNKQISGLLITEAEVAAILVALDEFGFSD